MNCVNLWPGQGAVFQDFIFKNNVGEFSKKNVISDRVTYDPSKDLICLDLFFFGMPEDDILNMCINDLFVIKMEFWLF